jgi:hypothetical protein
LLGFVINFDAEIIDIGVENYAGPVANFVDDLIVLVEKLCHHRLLCNFHLTIVRATEIFGNF